MGIPVSFRVVALNADESAHRAVLQEQRASSPPRLGPSNGCEPSVAILSTEVSPETFQSMRIGQVFELVPQIKDIATAQATPFPAGGFSEQGAYHKGDRLR